MTQYAVWVEFDLVPQHAADFRTAVLQNARASVANEPGCLRFDVLDALPAAPRILLYEIYADEAAFKAHLATPHFKVFDRESAPWIARKAITFANVTQIAKT
jgi:autoinducer 2-degrading protein